MNEDFITTLKEKTGEKIICKKLFSLRCKSKLSEIEMAEKLGWTKKKLLMFENTVDGDIMILDLKNYLNVLGYKLNVDFVEKT
jgi:hypothetical protein